MDLASQSSETIDMTLPSKERSSKPPWAQSVPRFRFFNAALARHRRFPGGRLAWALRGSSRVRKIPIIAGSLLLDVGVVILAYDAFFILSYGCDVNDMASVTEEGAIIAWPTGETPVWAQVPAFTYSFGFWLLSAAAFAVWRGMGRIYAGRICRGTE
jgi:hypothetical protein